MITVRANIHGEDVEITIDVNSIEEYVKFVSELIKMGIDARWSSH